LIPFVHQVYEQNRTALHGIPISLDEWHCAFADDADPHEVNFIICNEATPVAWLKLNGLHKPEICISMLVVDKAFQHEGAGKFAVQLAETYAKEHSKAAVLIQTTQDNVIAKKCYLNCGYDIVREMDYHAGGGIARAGRAGYEFKKAITAER